eukprot:g3034.t1
MSATGSESDSAVTSSAVPTALTDDGLLAAFLNYASTATSYFVETGFTYLDLFGFHDFMLVALFFPLAAIYGCWLCDRELASILFYAVGHLTLLTLPWGLFAFFRGSDYYVAIMQHWVYLDSPHGGALGTRECLWNCVGVVNAVALLFAFRAYRSLAARRKNALMAAAERRRKGPTRPASSASNYKPDADADSRYAECIAVFFNLEFWTTTLFWTLVLLPLVLTFGGGILLDAPLEEAFLKQYEATGKSDKFSGKTVLITNAVSGVGFHTAKWLSEWGRAKIVYLGAPSQELCERTQSKILRPDFTKLRCFVFDGEGVGGQVEKIGESRSSAEEQSEHAASEWEWAYLKDENVDVLIKTALFPHYPAEETAAAGPHAGFLLGVGRETPGRDNYVRVYLKEAALQKQLEKFASDSGRNELLTVTVSSHAGQMCPTMGVENQRTRMSEVPHDLERLFYSFFGHWLFSREAMNDGAGAKSVRVERKRRLNQSFRLIPDREIPHSFLLEHVWPSMDYRRCIWSELIFGAGFLNPVIQTTDAKTAELVKIDRHAICGTEAASSQHLHSGGTIGVPAWADFLRTSFWQQLRVGANRKRPRRSMGSVASGREPEPQAPSKELVAVLHFVAPSMAERPDPLRSRLVREGRIGAIPVVNAALMLVEAAGASGSGARSSSGSPAPRTASATPPSTILPESCVSNQGGLAPCISDDVRFDESLQRTNLHSTEKNLLARLRTT